MKYLNVIRQISNFFSFPICSPGGFATERGSAKGQLHLQGLVLVRCDCSEAGRQWISNSIKQVFPIPTGSGYKIIVKPFETGQTDLYMLGYIQKDSGEAHFHMCVKGFSQMDCIIGRSIHHSKTSNFEVGKNKLGKGDLVEKVHTYYTTNLYPLPLSVSQILRFMICSGTYIPAQTWVTPGLQGKDVEWRTTRPAFISNGQLIHLHVQ